MSYDFLFHANKQAYLAMSFYVLQFPIKQIGPMLIITSDGFQLLCYFIESTFIH